MPGIYILFDSSGSSLSDELVAKLAGVSNVHGCAMKDFRPLPALYVRNVYRPVTTAPGEMIHSPQRRVQLVFHGEVYNCPELAEYLGIKNPQNKSIADGPSLAAIGLEREGMRFVRRINGSFLLLAWYPAEQALYLANDRYGLRPHYYAWDNNILFVSPSVSAIHNCWGRKTKLNPRGIVEFFAFQQLMGNKTLVQGIELLPPATIFKVERASLKMDEYWDFPYPDKPVVATEEELKEELQRRLSVAVKRRLPANCPLGVPLSGGLDSRTLAGIASQSISNLPTFTYGDPNLMDRRFAHEVAKRIRAEHYCTSPQRANWNENFYTSVKVCEGMSSVKDGHIIMLFPKIAGHVGIVLDGLSGDMIFGSHLTRHMVSSRLPPNCADWLFNHKYISAFSPSEMKTLFVDKSLFDCLPLLGNALMQRVRMCRSSRWANVADYVNLRERQRRFILNGNTLLRSCVEVRTPFYDYDLIDFAITLPPHLRWNQRLYKDTIRNLLPDLRDIGHTPRGEKLVHSYRTRRMLSLLQRPDIPVREHMPSSIKNILRRMLRAVKVRKKSLDIDYEDVFANVMASIYSELDDISRGWKRLTSFNFIKMVHANLKNGVDSRGADKLSAWLTFQIYRDVYKL